MFDFEIVEKNGAGCKLVLPGRGLARHGVYTATCQPRQLAGRVGILVQDFEAQLVSTRVDHEVAFGPENLGLPREELRRRVRECLALVGLEVQLSRELGFMALTPAGFRQGVSGRA